MKGIHAMSPQQNLQIFVINLDKDTRRLKKFSARMQELVVPFTRWSATSGASLDPSYFGRKPISPGVFIKEFEVWSRNEAACGVSHIRLLQYLVENAVPWSLIMEDDGFLRKTIPLDINEWDIPGDAEIILVNNRSQYLNVCHKGSRFSYGELSGGAGTDGYLISLEGARKLLIALNPLHAPLDFQIFAHCSSIQKLDQPPYYWRLPQNPKRRDILLQAYRMVDPLVLHPDQHSTIGNQRHPRAHFYCNVLLGLFFQDGYTYTYSDILMQNHLSRKRSQQERVVKEWKGVDISLLDEGMTFWDPDQREDQSPMRILKESDVNLVRIAVWVDSSSVLNLKRALRLAYMARREGLQSYLVLHYSDTWADPAQQSKPKAWRTLSFEELGRRVYQYTREVVEEMCSIGCSPAIVQLGNEVTNGILWDEDNQENKHGIHRLLYDHEWLNFSTLMHHASRGVRDSIQPENTQPKIMLHFDNATMLEAATWWFNKAISYKLDFDMIGLSYYPVTHNGDFLRVTEDLSILNVNFPDKEIMLAETAYPYRNIYATNALISHNAPPFSIAGQFSYLRAVRNQMRKISNNAGVCWWGAFFVNDSVEQCSYTLSSQALFDRNGVVLPALKAFQDS
jgi:arabinogalactan endo-1,4-beta-galactosidase